MNAAECHDAAHCTTCSDEGIPVRVIAIAEDGAAVCEGEAGRRCEVLIDLIENVAIGDVVLAHAGVALTRIARLAPTAPIVAGEARGR